MDAEALFKDYQYELFKKLKDSFWHFKNRTPLERNDSLQHVLTYCDQIKKTDIDKYAVKKLDALVDIAEKLTERIQDEHIEESSVISKAFGDLLSLQSRFKSTYNQQRR